MRTSTDTAINKDQSCQVCGQKEFGFLFEKNSCLFWKCSNCGLERIHPQPDNNKLSRLYGPDYYDAWGLSVAEEEVRLLKMATFRHDLRMVGDIRKGSLLLDCGAATGFLMETASALGLEPYGVEISEVGASAIAAKFGAKRLFAGSWDQSSFPEAEPQGFDLVCMCDFIEHVPDPRGALHKAFSVLIPGGRLLLTTPDANSWSRRIMGKEWFHMLEEHLFYFTPANMILLLKQIGFRRIEVHRSWKWMNLLYVRSWLTKHRVPFITWLVSAISRILPESCLRLRFAVTMGEFLVVAVK
jgi:2-polyprenyl-3-methyl-5-hydroxy-6-metoxy-1,4-benzoquinol methylase